MDSVLLIRTLPGQSANLTVRSRNGPRIIQFCSVFLL